MALATDKQKAFIKSLAGDYAGSGSRYEQVVADTTTDEIVDQMDKQAASQMITWLLNNKPAKPRTTPAPTAIPAGRYALEFDEGVRFFLVDKPTQGKWAGYTFVNEQSGDNRIPVKDRDYRTMIIHRIEEDPKGAAIRYGRELGVCSICGHTLTDPDSIENGIGPVCATKFGEAVVA
jgi:hypothetical protein